MASSISENGKYVPIRAETSANTGSLRYSIQNIPIAWQLNKTDGRYDFCVVAISEDGQIVENLSSAYLSFDESTSSLSIAPVFGDKDFCVYVFRNEEAANLFVVNSDGSASLVSIFAQFEKDNRVLAQLQSLGGRNLRTLDECGVLPEASSRAGKVLSFDEQGNPIVSVEQDDITNIKAYKEAAETAKEEAVAAKEGIEAAQAACETAKTAAQDSADKAKASETKVEQSAQRAAENAQSAEFSKSYAESYANTAQTAATTAEQEATAAILAKDQAETAQTASENAKTAAETAKTQAQAAKQAAVDAANTATQAVGVQDLKQSKTERGTYYINGGTITSAAFALNAPFTYFITYKAGFVGYLFSKGNTTLSIVANGTLTLIDGTNAATVAMDATKDHLIAVEVLATSAKIIVDGIEANGAPFAFVDIANTGIVIGGTTTVGKLARPILFNFGISETNAPYTFTDYQSGKALSPYLTNAIAKVEDPNLGASTDGGWDISEPLTTPTNIKKGDWTLKQWSETATIYYLKNRTITDKETAAGITYAVDCRMNTIIAGYGCLYNDVTNFNLYNRGKMYFRCKFKGLKITNNLSYGPYQGIMFSSYSGQGQLYHVPNGTVNDHEWHNYDSGIQTVDLSKITTNLAGSVIGFSAGGLEANETGPSWSIADLHFDILGALFAPADFVITTGTTRNIPDLSGQGKDATLSGNFGTVKTDNDIRVAKLKEYFTANS